MKKIIIVIAVIGVGLGIGLVVWLGAGKIWRALVTVGWIGFGSIVGWQFLTFLVLAAAWHRFCPDGRYLVLVWGRLVREGAANILPFSEAGALAFGARAITIGGVTSTVSIASSLADVAAEFIGEIPFILFGVAVLLVRGPKGSLLIAVIIGAGIVIAGAVALMRRGADLGGAAYIQAVPGDRQADCEALGEARAKAGG